MSAPKSPVHAPDRARAVIAYEWTADDRLRPATVAAALIVVAAPVMAVIGIPPVPIMWPLHGLGIVLPGCGLTRGVVALARGDVVGAWRWNPASLAAAAFAAAGVARLVVGARTGRWFHIRVRPRWWLIVPAGLAVGGLWLRQWAIAEVLMSGR